MPKIERETLELDVVFVGAGPASLAGAYRLATRIAEHNQGAAEPLEVSIAVLEKGKDLAAHALSGAVVDPRGLRELMPGEWRGAPLEGPVADEKLLWMTSKRALSMPIPPMLENDGKYVASLGKLNKWLGEKVEAAGADIFCEFPAAAALVEDGRVVGVRTGDRGLDRDGKPKPNFEPGIDIRSRVTVLGEGPRGTITKQLRQRFDLDAGKNPQVYAIGLKELWQLPPGRVQPGQVAHTMGWPLGTGTFGGGFLYGMQDDLLIVGLVVGLDYRNPWLDPHEEFQRFKTHPEIAKLLAGGELRNYGAKAIPEGGLWSMPRLWGDGFLIVGDSGGFLNSQRLKGVHLAMKSGMLAADTIFEALLRDDASAESLARYDAGFRDSWAYDELYDVRNFHQAFDYGMVGGMAQAGLGMLTRGRGWGILDRLHSKAGHRKMRRISSDDGAVERPDPVVFDGELTFDKLADVYQSATAHEEDQPVHLLVADTDLCVYQCTVEYGNPCQRFCPANVYEMVDDAERPTGRRLQINASNCVHCKTCDIMDPYQVITWVPPEGGGGPSYGRM